MLCYIVVGFVFFKQKPAYELRMSDWSSDVCSSDLCCTPFTGGQTRNSSTGSMRHSPLSDFSAETRPVLIAFMSVWRVTPTFSDAFLRVIPMMSLAVKSACIVSIYRLSRQGERHRARGACFLGRCRAGIGPLASQERGSVVRWRADPAQFHL